MTDLQIIDNICQTLDVSLVSKLTQESYQKLIPPFLTNYKKKGVNGFKHKSLAMLLYNYLTYTLKGITPFKFPSYIMGPKLLIKLTSEKHNKTLYMFGESHIDYEPSKYKCVKDSMEVADFIKNIITYSDKPIDFYLETSPDISQIFIKTKSWMSPKSYKETYLNADLGKLRSLVSECIGITKNKCIYHTTRSHYFDLRQTELYPFLGAGISFTKSYNIYKVNISMLSYRLSPDYKSLFSRKLTILDEELFSFVDLIRKEIPIVLKIESSDFIHSINKQINRTNDIEVIRIINQQLELFNDKRHTYMYKEFLELYNMVLSYMKKEKYVDKLKYTLLKGDYYKGKISCFFYIRSLYQMVMDIYDKNKKDINLPEIAFSILKCVHDYTVKVGLVLTDLYTLGRMFRAFKQVQHQNSIEPRNIIYYGGANHTKNLITILTEELGFEKEEFPTTLAEPSNNRYPWCIDISSLNGKLF